MESTCFLWNHQQHGQVIGVGSSHELKLRPNFDHTLIQDFFTLHKGKYIFGYLSYDLKNEFENLSSNHQDHLDFPLLHFWVPDSLFQVKEKPFLLWGSTNETHWHKAEGFLSSFFSKDATLNIPFEARTEQSRYTQQFDQLKNALQRGDIYEVNYCQEFYVEQCSIERPLALFGRLNELTKAPHAAYFQTDTHYVLCASPERFIQKTGSLLR